jgi:serine protease
MKNKTTHKSNDNKATTNFAKTRGFTSFGLSAIALTVLAGNLSAQSLPSGALPSGALPSGALPSKALLSNTMPADLRQAPSNSTAPVEVTISEQYKARYRNTKPKKSIKVSDLLAEERFIVTFMEPKNLHKDDNNFSTDSRGSDSQNAVSNGRLNEQAALNILRTAGAQQIRAIDSHNMVVAKMTKAVAHQLLQNDNVADISIDARRELMAETTPYGINMVQAPQLSQDNLAARKVCVIDTGYNLNHPDLPDSGDGVSGQANNNQVGNWYNDGNGHGTHVAGTIAALSNTQGVVGVYPGVDMHIVKIFNDNGQWTFASDLITAISQCANAGSNVVNMSLGGGSPSNAEQTAMQNFADDGILLVAAAGNAGNSTKSYPASYPAVMSVAAVDSSENRASYSQYNNSVEIAGPGSAVQSTWPVNTYNSISGTSMATPHVVGAAALVWSFFPQCTNEQIRDALNATAKDKGSAGRDNFYGHGIVKVRDAYDYIADRGCDGSGGGGGGGSVTPVDGQLNNLSANRNAWKRYTWNVPAGVSTLTVRISGGSGDADLYMKLGSEPQTNSYDCRPYLSGNSEVCTFNNPQAGEWNIGIRAYSRFRNVTMNYSYE